MEWVKLHIARRSLGSRFTGGLKEPEIPALSTHGLCKERMQDFFFFFFWLGTSREVRAALPQHLGLRLGAGWAQV